MDCGGEQAAERAVGRSKVNDALEPDDSLCGRIAACILPDGELGALYAECAPEQDIRHKNQVCE